MSVKTDDRYSESDDHVPSGTDMLSQLNTSGTGASGRIEEVAAIFEQDKLAVAEEIKGALDPKDDTVSSDRVLFDSPTYLVADQAEAKAALVKAADARIKKGANSGGLTPAQAEAAEGDKPAGSKAAGS